MSHKPFDYSKWDNIEISDDEEDCHPNIDKSSWFRMKHRSRVEREDLEEQEKISMRKENEQNSKRIKEIEALLAEIERGGEAAEYEDSEALESEKAELALKIQERLEKIAYMEENRKWNIDNICHTASDKTIISNTKSSDPSELREGSLLSGGNNNTSSSLGGKQSSYKKKNFGPESEKDAVLSYAKFVEHHEAEMDEFLACIDLDDAKKLLHQNGGILLHEHAQSYALLSCLEDEMNGFHEKMKRAAQNSQLLAHITELAVSMNRHPRDVVLPFFHRIQDSNYLSGFQDAVQGFITRIQKRAIDKRKEMDAEAKVNGDKDKLINEDGVQVELSKEERLGPGGLDPVEVFESLPKAMQDAFESKDTGKLQAALESMPLEDAKYHMKRCEDSGLWVSNSSAQDDAPQEEDNVTTDDHPPTPPAPPS
uniref:Hsp90 chaperone protein kinase-targeting subunit n=1 Tax=Aureoumbra lagunensis TaxID=44058 RepID=A0A7S3NDY3_9STRA|mmetsp:Transcript_23006/g.29793  ORF Transcript_23006/g.29793 Transcript_23006/m.29793 type:complete len:425 (+) Transcript_23006:39-1313(+)